MFAVRKGPFLQPQLKGPKLGIVWTETTRQGTWCKDLIDLKLTPVLSTCPCVASDYAIHFTKGSGDSCDSMQPLISCSSQWIQAGRHILVRRHGFIDFVNASASIRAVSVHHSSPPQGEYSRLLFWPVNSFPSPSSHRSHPGDSIGQASPLTPSFQHPWPLNPCASRNLYPRQSIRYEQTRFCRHVRVSKSTSRLLHKQQPGQWLCLEVCVGRITPF